MARDGLAPRLGFFILRLQPLELTPVELPLLLVLLDTGIRAEREERRRGDGAVEYIAITPEFSLFQAVKAGYVSRLVFSL